MNITESTLFIVSKYLCARHLYVDACASEVCIVVPISSLGNVRLRYGLSRSGFKPRGLSDPKVASLGSIFATFEFKVANVSQLSFAILHKTHEHLFLLASQ